MSVRLMSVQNPVAIRRPSVASPKVVPIMARRLREVRKVMAVRSEFCLC